MTTKTTPGLLGKQQGMALAKGNGLQNWNQQAVLMVDDLVLSPRPGGWSAQAALCGDLSVQVRKSWLSSVT